MKKIFFTSVTLALIALSSCGENKAKEPSFAEQMAAESEASEKEAASAELDNIGVGPISTIEFTEAINQTMADKGKALFEEKCVACHKTNEKLIGPALAGVTERRNPAWIMNMILNPAEMIEKDPIAMRLMEEYKTPMLKQDLTEEEAREVLEYFRII